MQPLSLGELTIIEIALISLMKGVDENSELGQQILECIAKIDIWIKDIRAEFETQAAAKSHSLDKLAPLKGGPGDLTAAAEK